MADPVAPDANQLADFQGLPLKCLMIDPIVAAASAQKELAAVTLDFINTVGFTKDEQGNVAAAVVAVDVPRFVVGKEKPVYERVSMPLLSVVTIPNLAISNIDVEFNMEVKSHTADNTANDTSNTDKSDTDTSASMSGGFWGVKASASVKHSSSHTGVVSSHADNTRSSDFSAKYNIKISATQMPPAEGMSRFTQILSNTIESQPINTASPT